MSEAPQENAVRPDPRRWRALAFIAIAQLMVVLDVTIVNIALPSAQVDLGISDGNRQWVITAYALAFGGLLLLGGRIADMWGRARSFNVGLLGFAAASALGGAAVNEAMMLASRALQGVFAALLAPSALSLLAVLFIDPKERAKALGVFAAVAGTGAATGLIVGGVLTEYLEWRWVFFVNIPMAAIGILGSVIQIRDPAGSRDPSPLDIPGVLLGTAGLLALVYGFSRAESAGWGDGVTASMFVTAVVLLTAFVLVERKVKAPLLPLRVVLDRNRGGAYMSIGLGIIAMFGLYLFLTYYMQVIQGYSPVKTGLAFLPVVGGMLIGNTQISARLMTRVPARYLMGPGFLVATIGMLLLTQLEPGSSFVGLILPAEVLFGLGLGMALMPAWYRATSGVQSRDAGVASAMINTSQQVGGAVGVALLNTIAAGATTSYIAANITGISPPELVQVEGTVHGYTTAIWWAAGILVFAAIVAYLMVRPTRSPPLDRTPLPQG